MVGYTPVQYSTGCPLKNPLRVEHKHKLIFMKTKTIAITN